MPTPRQMRRTVLHVDDDQAVLRGVAKLLAAHDFEVVSVGDAEDALRQLSERGIRLVLVDIDLPGRDGLQLLKEIKALDGGVQVVMVTGVTTISTILRAMRWGAEACVFKPLDDAAPLLDAVNAAFDKIDQWWIALDELQRRKHGEESLVAS